MINKNMINKKPSDSKQFMYSDKSSNLDYLFDPPKISKKELQMNEIDNFVRDLLGELVETKYWGNSGGSADTADQEFRDLWDIYERLRRDIGTSPVETALAARMVEEARVHHQEAEKAFEDVRRREAAIEERERKLTLDPSARLTEALQLEEQLNALRDALGEEDRRLIALKKCIEAEREAFNAGMLEEYRDLETRTQIEISGITDRKLKLEEECAQKVAAIRDELLANDRKRQDQHQRAMFDLQNEEQRLQALRYKLADQEATVARQLQHLNERKSVIAETRALNPATDHTQQARELEI